MEILLTQADRVGFRLFELWRYIRGTALMIYLAFRSAFNDRKLGFRQILSVVSAQIYFTGWQGMPLVTILALAAGGIAILQSSAQLSLLGGTSMLGNILVVIIVRELGPLITALVVIARSGTAVASELGNMRVNREIEALEVMGIHPLSYIVFPRLLGGVISVLCLSFYFNLISLVGGFVVSRAIHDLPFWFYVDSLATAFSMDDVVLFLLKNTFSGLIIFTVACQQGLSVHSSSHEVPQVTARAVVHAIVAVTSFNLLVTLLFYLNQLMRLGIL